MNTPLPEYLKSGNPINWYPGHMLKAKKELQGRLKQVDVILELRDARIPLASVNKDIETVLNQKHRLILLNKSGLADPQAVKQWKTYFHNEGISCHFMDIKQNQGVKEVLPLARLFMKAKWERFEAKGIRHPELRLMVVGIPNVGKSSLINKLVKRHAAKTGPHPGVTKQQEWVRLGHDAELLDTPGILWPKFDRPEIGFMLAVTGAIKDQVAGEQRLALYLIHHFLEHYSSLLTDFYRLDSSSLVDDSDSPPPIQTLEAIAKKRGCLKGGGEFDLQRASNIVLRDFREGKLGQVSFQWPTLD